MLVDPVARRRTPCAVARRARRAAVGLRFAGLRRFQHPGLPRPSAVAARARGDHRRADAADHALINWVVRGRRPGALTLGATVVALAGVVLVITHGPLASGSRGDAARRRDGAGRRDLLGCVHMGAAVVPQFSPLRYTALSMSARLGDDRRGHASPQRWPGSRIRPRGRCVASVRCEIGYLSLVGGVLAVLAWNAGIGILGPANGVLFINLVPITAFAIGVAQGHRFGASEIAACCWSSVRSSSTTSPRGTSRRPDPVSRKVPAASGPRALAAPSDRRKTAARPIKGVKCVFRPEAVPASGRSLFGDAQ